MVDIASWLTFDLLQKHPNTCYYLFPLQDKLDWSVWSSRDSVVFDWLHIFIHLLLVPCALMLPLFWWITPFIH